MNKICLSTMVKNESAIITRMLDSIKDTVDYIHILDTGSTDSTIKVIKDWCIKNGFFNKYKIDETFFVNFEISRNEGLEKALKTFPDANFILVCDADMEFVNTAYATYPGVYLSPFNKNRLDRQVSAYSILQVNGLLEYPNVRLINTSYPWKYKGVTHEALVCEGNPFIKKLDNCYFIDHNDGGCKDDKYERDLHFLFEELQKNPNDTRTLYYIADAFKALKRYTEAITYYNRRIELGGWDEEVYYSKCCVMNCVKEMGKPFEEWFLLGMLAWSSRPQRLESLYLIINYCRENGFYELGYNLGKNVTLKFPSKDVLNVNGAIHRWSFIDELSLCAFNVGDIKLAKSLIKKIINEKHYPPSEHTRLLKNLDICEKLEKK